MWEEDIKDSLEEKETSQTGKTQSRGRKKEAQWLVH